MRVRIAGLAAAFIFLFIILWLMNLQVIGGRKFRELSDRNCIRLLPQEGSRGNIFDRRGSLIAGSQLSYDVMVMPGQEEGLDRLLSDISRVTGIGLGDLRDKFKKGYISLFTPVTVARNIDVKKAIALEELKSEHSGVVIQPRPLRYYPYARLAVHLLGYLGEIDHWRLTKLEGYGYKTKDIVGFGGVEERYDYYLRQEEGGLSVEVDHRGRFVRVLGFRPPKSGKDIRLSLDLKIQKIVEDNFVDRKGSVIIMDPFSGEIIAMASSPNFNPASFVTEAGPRINSLFNDPAAPMINRSISGLYPAGSVFKVIVVAAALETGKIRASTSFYCPGSLRLGRQEFNCWNTHNQQDLFGALTHSCNVFFYRTGLLVGPDLIHDYALKLGLSKPTGIDLPYEAGGFIPSSLWRKVYKFKNWFDGDTLNLSIGQGDVLVTPIQLTRMMAVFANNGFLVTPHVLKAIEERDFSGAQRKAVKVSLKASTIEYIRRGLRNVVADPTGTANVLSTPLVAVAGKTGTVQVSRGQPHAWFVGFFPFKEPKFVICVFLEHGGSGIASCILTRQILEMMIKEGLV